MLFGYFLLTRYGITGANVPTRKKKTKANGS